MAEAPCLALPHSQHSENYTDDHEYDLESIITDKLPLEKELSSCIKKQLSLLAGFQSL